MANFIDLWPCLLSFLPDYCHSFPIIVIPFILVSFLLNYCHSFRIIAVSKICHPEQLPTPKGEKFGRQGIFKMCMHLHLMQGSRENPRFPIWPVSLSLKWPLYIHAWECFVTSSSGIFSPHGTTPAILQSEKYRITSWRTIAKQTNPKCHPTKAASMYFWSVSLVYQSGVHVLLVSLFGIPTVQSISHFFWSTNFLLVYHFFWSTKKMRN